MMMQLGIHQVRKIELSVSFPGNGNSRTIVVSYGDPADPQKFELTVYGQTEAFDILPKADDFRVGSLAGYSDDEEIQF